MISLLNDESHKKRTLLTPIHTTALKESPSNDIYINHNIAKTCALEMHIGKHPNLPIHTFEAYNIYIWLWNYQMWTHAPRSIFKAHL